MGKLTGRITEFLGQWTNDRETEARGRAAQKQPESGASLPEPDDAQVEKDKEEVRRDHGDVSR